VNKQQTIAKLEALLTRVRARTAEPRRPVVPAAPAAPPILVGLQAPVAAPVAHEPPPPPPAQAASREEPRELLDEEITLAEERPAAAATDAEVVMDVEVQETVIGVAGEEVAVAEAFESRERLVAAEPVAADSSPDLSQDAETVIRQPVDRREPEVLAVEEESPPELLAAVEEVEETPASSRRPVVPEPEERLAELAFGTQEPRPPRHTPPPESGRRPAAPELVAEATRAEIPASDAVATVIGEAARFSPSTFVELVDASLAL